MPRHHVFLSHSSADKPAVEELARRLKQEGIEPWLDKWNLIPGEPWQPRLEEALKESATCAVFIGPSAEELREQSPQKLQKAFPHYRELVEDMKHVNEGLIEYANALRQIARGN